jgi:predicted NBD/HSP70 family sugar kinase
MATTAAGLRNGTVRSANLASILGELHVRGARSRSDLVATTGLTRSAVGALVGELARVGLVTERRSRSDGSPGRPSPLVVPMHERAVAIGVEVTVDTVAAASVGLGGRLLDVRRAPRRRADGQRADVASTVDHLVDLVTATEAATDPDSTIVGVGVAVQGLVRRSDRTVTVAPNLGWRDVPLGDALGAALGAALGRDVPLVIANDAEVAALAELRRGRAVGVDDVIHLWGDVGVGGGIVSGGRMIAGASGYAGEVGHMAVNPDGRRCGCGSIGCWETEVGQEALLRRAGADPARGRVGVDEVFAAAAAGDDTARAALAEQAHWVGVGVATLVNILDPTLVVLGGRFERLFAEFGTEIDAEIRRRALPDAASRLLVTGSALGDDALVLGGAELAFEPLLADPLTLVTNVTRRP